MSDTDETDLTPATTIDAERGVITIDATRLPLIRAALVEAHTSDVRHAERHGWPVPEAPTLAIECEWSYRECLKCRRAGKVLGVPSAPDAGDLSDLWYPTTADQWLSSCCQALTRRHDLARVKVTCGRPTLGDWELVAVIEGMAPDHEGNPSPNMIRKVPGSDVEVPERFRTDDYTWCDHCEVRRQRSETFLLWRASDRHMMQVGRQCLAAFLGGVPFESIVRRLAWLQALIERFGSEEGGGGGGDDRPAKIEDVLAITACVIRNDGWMSKGKAMEWGKESTASRVEFVLYPPDRDASESERRRWREEVARLAPQNGDMARAVGALAWARGLDGRSDYELNLRTACMQATVNGRNMGIVCSAVAGYDRHTGRETERRRLASLPTIHYGQPGGKIGAKVGKGKKAVLGAPFVGVIERLMPRENDFGTTTLVVARGTAPGAEEGTTLINWWMSGPAPDAWRPGLTCEIRGTIKKHDVYHGRNITVMTRCALTIVRDASEISTDGTEPAKQVDASEIVIDSAGDADAPF